jgi:uncharacterized protein YqhQ
MEALTTAATPSKASTIIKVMTLWLSIVFISLVNHLAQVLPGRGPQHSAVNHHPENSERTRKNSTTHIKMK